MSHSKALSHDYQERLRSLVVDNYCIRFDHRDPRLWFARLKHMSNGNMVLLKADFTQMQLTQITNNVIKHQQNYA